MTSTNHGIPGSEPYQLPEQENITQYDRDTVF